MKDIRTFVHYALIVSGVLNVLTYMHSKTTYNLIIGILSIMLGIIGMYNKKGD